MNRRQRRQHARLWPLLALIMIVIVGVGLAAQQRPAISTAISLEAR